MKKKDKMDSIVFPVEDSFDKFTSLLESAYKTKLNRGELNEVLQGIHMQVLIICFSLG